MEEGKEASRYLVCSSSRSFSKRVKKSVERVRFGEEIITVNSFQHIDQLVKAGDILFIDEELILQGEKTPISRCIDVFVNAQVNVFLYSNYKTRLPDLILDNPAIFHVVSKSIRREELEFQLSSFEHRRRNYSIDINQKQEEYLEAIIQIQNLLIRNYTTKDVLAKILTLLGNVTQACRVSLFENKFDYSGKPLMSQRYEWTNHGVLSQEGNPLFNLLPYYPNFERWDNTLSLGDHISGDIMDFPHCERPLLSTHDINRLLLIPIIIKGNFWGFIMFSICTSRELWPSHEISLIKSTVGPIISFLEIKIEEKKREVSDARLRSIFESSNIGLVLASKEGILKSFNPAFSEMLGYTENELKNINFRVFTHPDDLSKELPLLNSLLEGRIPSYLIEKRYIAKGGKQIWVKLNVSAFSKEKGKPESLVGIIENISKEKEAERALQESEVRYKKLSDLSLEGIVIHQYGQAVDCNERFLEMSGYSREELIGKNLIELLADASSKASVIEKIQTDYLLPYEAVGITKSGRKIAVELENRLVEKEDETLRVTVFRDITDRKKSEQEIRKLNIAINQSPSSIVITNIDGEIEYVNKSFCEITGYTVDEALGKNPRILKTENHSDDYYKGLWETISRGKTWHGTFRNKTKTGEYYWERAVISPIFDDKKNLTHYLAIKENITKEKEAQEALKISEERHRIISQLTNDFVYSAKIEKSALRFDWTSGSNHKLVGYSIHELEEFDFGWYSVVLEEDLEDVVLPSIAKLTTENILNLEYRIKTKTGKIKWVIDKIQLIAEDEKSDVFKVMGAIQDITKRMEANLELDQSKRYLDSIIDNLPIGLHIFDEQGYTARINETQRKILGVKDLNVGKGTFNILKDSLSKTTGSDKVYREVYKNKTTVNHEIEVSFDSGNKWETRKGTASLNEIIFPILKNDGSIHSVISLLNDITKRVNAEKALKVSETHQKALLKIIPDLIFVFTEDGFFKDVYTEDAERLIMPVDQFIGKPFSEVFPGEQSETFYAHLKLAVETREMQSYNYELKVDGVSEFFESRLLTSKENEVIAIIRDITESINAERALKDSEEKFRELAERTQDALVLISVTNEIIYVSPNLENIMGISAESYSRNPLNALKMIYAKDKNWVIPELNNYRKGRQKSLDLQFRVVAEHQKLKWIWYRESTVFDADDNPVRYAAVITDITANKAAELELKVAKEEAEKASRSKSSFLANISHEIRTPMNAVLGFSDLLYSRIQDPVLKGYLNSIKSSGKTLLNLLNDILDLSKIEAKKMTIIPSPVNLFEVFEEIKHIFSLKALEKGLDYTFDIDKNLPRSLVLDELRIKQILLNLVDNAVKFTDEGKIKIIVTRIDSKEQLGTADISIVVEDTGIGVPDHLHSSIFESFRQQDDKDKKKFQGTGLGLAITKRLVELFEGEIFLKSQPGKGSRFEVILRQIIISKPLENSSTKEQRSVRFENSVLKDKVIVLIDTEPSNRELVKEVFFHSESKVVEGERFEDIFPKIIKSADLIIMELKNADSIERDLAAINNVKELKNIPKVGISSLSEIDNRYTKEFLAILTKPIHLPDLVEIVANHFQISNTNEGLYDQKPQFGEKIDRKALMKAIKKLEDKHYKQWEYALKSSSFSEIEDFAQNLKNLGLKCNLTSLQSFSDVLVMHAKNFDIDNMNAVLRSFPALVIELKSILKQSDSEN